MVFLVWLFFFAHCLLYVRTCILIYNVLVFCYLFVLLPGALLFQLLSLPSLYFNLFLFHDFLIEFPHPLRLFLLSFDLLLQELCFILLNLLKLLLLSQLFKSLKFSLLLLLFFESELLLFHHFLPVKLSLLCFLHHQLPLLKNVFLSFIVLFFQLVNRGRVWALSHFSGAPVASWRG